MTPAATVLVCALDLLGRSPESFPPIELLDVRPAHASVNAEAFVESGVNTIYLLTTSEVFQTALKAGTRCGNRNALRKLASIIVHEEWHVRHGSDEGGAYAAQLTTVQMLGGQDTALYNSVRRAMVTVLAQRRAAQVATIASR